MSHFTPVTHVIFDLDGLLIDTESLYTVATQSVLDAFGKKFTWDVKLKMMGKTSLDAARIIVEELQLPISPNEFMELADAQYKVVFPQAKFMPGAEQLVKHLHQHRIPIAIATGSDEYNYGLKTKNHKDFFSLFQHVVLTSSDPEVKRGKPAPDAFLICACRFEDRPLPEKVLVFEDAPNGVAAAVAAGMQVIMVPDANIPKEMTNDATVVLPTLEQFNPGDFGLPPM